MSLKKKERSYDTLSYEELVHERTCQRREFPVIGGIIGEEILEVAQGFVLFQEGTKETMWRSVLHLTFIDMIVRLREERDEFMGEMKDPRHRMTHIFNAGEKRQSGIQRLVVFQRHLKDVVTVLLEVDVGTVKTELREKFPIFFPEGDHSLKCCSLWIIHVWIRSVLQETLNDV